MEISMIRTPHKESRGHRTCFANTLTAQFSQLVIHLAIDTHLGREDPNDTYSPTKSVMDTALALVANTLPAQNSQSIIHPARLGYGWIDTHREEGDLNDTYSPQRVSWTPHLFRKHPHCTFQSVSHPPSKT